MKNAKIILGLGVLLLTGITSVSCEEDTGQYDQEQLSTNHEKATRAINCSGCKQPSLQPNSVIEGKQLSSWVQNYSPKMRFDQAASTFPVNAQEIWQRSQNRNCGARLSLSNSSPYPFHQLIDKGRTYYQAALSNNRLFIEYWWGYFKQTPCLGNSGAHDYDWERILVQIDTRRDRTISVTFYQHGQWYSLLPNSGKLSFGRSILKPEMPRKRKIQFSGKHPIVYVGKISHGSYDYGNRTIGGCGYYDDHRDGNWKEWNTWDSKIIPLKCNGGEEWMSFNGDWGRVGKGPMFRNFDPLNLRACKGSRNNPISKAGCFRSVGHDEIITQLN